MIPYTCAARAYTAGSVSPAVCKKPGDGEARVEDHGYPLRMAPKNLLTEWACVLFSSFADAGIQEVVISPGSRPTPFITAAVRERRLRCHSVVDERAAAFFALGQARLCSRPSLLLCTSGSAGAHYFPAIIEASASYVPLVVVTAD